MKKIVLAVTAAAAALAAPIATATAAHAADATPIGSSTIGSLDELTTTGGQTYHHVFDVTYTCDTLNGKSLITYKALDPNQTGPADGTIVPDATGGGVFTLRGGFDNMTGYAYEFGGEFGSDGVWTKASATDSSGTFHLGTDGANGTDVGSVIGKFNGVPTCATAMVDVPGNHGEYVSGAAHAGIKGQALAKIAKDVTLVGPYKG
jgi:hypothetical protein